MCSHPFHLWAMSDVVPGSEPLDGRDDGANPPTCGPLLMLSPALKRWGSLRRQGLCSHLAHLGTSDFVPCSKGRDFKKEHLPPYRCLQTIRCSWSPQVKNAGLNALTNRLGTRLEHSPRITEQYVEQRSNLAGRDCPDDNFAATPSKPHANMLKHHRFYLGGSLASDTAKDCQALGFPAPSVFWACPSTRDMDVAREPSGARGRCVFQ